LRQGKGKAGREKGEGQKAWEKTPPSKYKCLFTALKMKGE